MSEAKAFALHHVKIDRDKEHVTTYVPAHEIRVLEAIHGFDKVKDLGPTDDTIDLDPSAVGEFARLRRKYHRINSPDPVLRAYPTGPRELEGFSASRSASAEAPQSMVRKHPKPKADEAKAEGKKKAD